MESRSLQESHLLVTTMGWDSPPTHLRAVSEHVDAAGDVVHGALHPPASKQECLQTISDCLVRCGVRARGHTTHRHLGRLPRCRMRRVTHAEERQHRQPPMADGAVRSNHEVFVVSHLPGMWLLAILSGCNRNEAKLTL